MEIIDPPRACRLCGTADSACGHDPHARPTVVGLIRTTTSGGRMGNIAKEEILEEDANGNMFVRYAAGDPVGDDDAKKYARMVEKEGPPDEPVSGTVADDDTGLIVGDTFEGRRKRKTPAQNKAKAPAGDK